MALSTGQRYLRTMVQRQNLFPDSGAFIYGGDEEVWKQRNWFRQTAVHNTLTLDNKNIETTQSVTKLWKTLPDAQVLVTEIQVIRT